MLRDELSGKTMQGLSGAGASQAAPSSMPACMSPPDRRPRPANGWMTSMTDITEPNRIRAQLGLVRALHHRAGKRWTPRCRWRRWAARSCCLPTGCTASGLAHTPVATCNKMRSRPARLPNIHQPTEDEGEEERHADGPAHRPHHQRQPENAENLPARTGQMAEMRSRYLSWSMAAWRKW